MSLIGGIAAGIGSIASSGMGMAMGKKQDKRQLRQQEKLQKLQIEGGKELGKFNQELAMQTWRDTNYEAKRREMQKAGLNVGLMYEGGGQGGTTAGGQAQLPTGATATGASGQEWGMGMQLGLQQIAQAAEIKLIQAQTEKTKAEAEKTAGVDTKHVQAGIDKLKADTENSLIQTEIAVYDKNLRRIESNIAEDTEQELIQSVKYQNDKLIAEIQSAQAQGKIDKETADDKIQQTKTASQEQALRIAAQKAGLIKTGADTEQVKAATAKLVQELGLDREENVRAWRAMDQKQQEIFIQQKVANNAEMQAMFNVDQGAKAKRWSEILNNIIPF